MMNGADFFCLPLAIVLVVVIAAQASLWSGVAMKRRWERGWMDADQVEEGNGVGNACSDLCSSRLMSYPLCFDEETRGSRVGKLIPDRIVTAGC